MKKFLLIANRQKDIGLEVSKRMESFLISNQAESVRVVAVDKQFFEIPASFLEEAECVLVLGGDGTLLRAAKHTVAYNLPILGINMGHLGYLSEIERDNSKDALMLLIRDEYELEQRMMLSGEVRRDSTTLCRADALNDIVITRGGSLQVLEFDVFVNGKKLKSFTADGVIAATPTGSTAYNLSAGGPIVEPGADLIVITPISPHTLMNRSIILKSEDEITIKIKKSHEEDSKQVVEVNFDGQSMELLKPDDCVNITRSQQTVSLMKINNVSFLETLGRKMSEV